MRIVSSQRVILAAEHVVRGLPILRGAKEDLPGDAESCIMIWSIPFASSAKRAAPSSKRWLCIG